jgi:transglutaminase superfamily protein
MNRVLASLAAGIALTAAGMWSGALAPGSALAKDAANPKATAAKSAPEVRGTAADRIMRQATARMVHDGPGGLNEDNLSLGELLARYDQGETLYIRCGNQAIVAKALLARQGIRSRLIGVLKGYGPFNGDDGHMFMEVWIKHRWIAYDPDGNRQPVDDAGRPMGAVREMTTRPFHWRYIASDPYSEAYTNYTYADLDRDVARVMGILVIIDGSPDEGYHSYYLGTPAAVQRVDSYPVDLEYTPVDRSDWANLTKGEG